MVKHRKKEEYKSLFEYYGFTKKDERECPVVSGILRELTPKRIKQEIEKIQAEKLPVELLKWVEEYEKVGDRDRFLWKWTREISQVITFPGVPKRFHKCLGKIKFLMIMWIVVIDDVADKTQSPELLKEILKIPFRQETLTLNDFSPKQKNNIDFTRRIWQELQEEIRILPCYEQLSPIFAYDIEQILNGIKYGYLISQEFHLSNMVESRIYLAHNTPAILSFMLDIMCISNFAKKKLRSVRTIAWHAQKMTRIANDIATWQREIREDDVSSGITIYAFEHGILRKEDIKRSRCQEVFEKVREANIEKKFLAEWEDYYYKISKIDEKTLSEKERQGIAQILRVSLMLHLVSKKLI